MRSTEGMRGADGTFASALLFLLAACAASPTPAPPGATPQPSTSVIHVPTAGSTPTSPAAEADPTLAELVDAPAMGEHLEALQAIVDDSPFGETNRATGSVAFDESARYVHRELLSARYDAERQDFSADGVGGVNIITELPGASDEVLMLGAHVDSVVAGPGINDNGSGVAALLVIAEQLRRGPRPALTVRFAFWGAEENGSVGSRAYVDALSPEERGRIRAYLNFDMLASPNAVRFVYEEAGAATGSEAWTAAFGAAFDEAGLAWDTIDLEGDSDHGPFIEADIPTGGIFSGGIEPVTDAQAAAHGAIAGEPADPCSHRACDTIDNVDLGTLEEMADAIAAVLATVLVVDR